MNLPSTPHTVAARPGAAIRPHAAIRLLALAALALVVLFGTTGCGGLGTTFSIGDKDIAATAVAHTADGDLTLDDIPAYTGDPYVVIDNNVPTFPEEDLEPRAFEEYSPLDELGRCGVAYACLGLETMPTEPRGDIREIRPSGWNQEFYDFIVGETVYTRAHLIAHSLAGEDANSRNLITGTRYMNADVMTEFEIAVDDYIEDTGNHVLYRVTPLFDGDDLVARGVHMEALSVEDGGRGISFNVFLYNVQPGVEVDYATGENWANPDVPGPDGEIMGGAGDGAPAEADADAAAAVPSNTDYVLNTRSGKFHRPDCESVGDIGPNNRQAYVGSRETLIEQGYAPCGSCEP